LRAATPQPSGPFLQRNYQLIACCCIVIAVATLLVIGGELLWSQDHFLLGRNASTELDVRLRPLSADVTLSLFSTQNPYFASESHQWMFFHFRGDVMRYPHSSQSVITSDNYWLFRRWRWLHHGTVVETWYSLDLPGLLPLVAASAGVIALRSYRKSVNLRGNIRGFPVDGLPR
jgi:hypothetical protein